MNDRSASAVTIVEAAVFVCVALATASAHSYLSNVTWAKDIAPIVQKRCAGCHRPGGIAPMSLVDYAEAKAWAKTIKTQVLERQMPPWYAARGFGDFENDPTLTQTEIDTIVSWAEGGAASGVDAVRPVPRRAADTGRRGLREPDLVLAPPAPQAVTEATHVFDFPTDFAADRWISAWEFRPGNRAIVKQARIVVDNVPLGTWVPPEQATVFPDGTGQRLPARARIRLEIDYQKGVGGAPDRSSLAVQFTERVSRPIQYLRLACGTTKIAKPISALAICPRQRSYGGAIEVVARRPDGGAEALGWIRNFQRQYEVTYRFRHAVELPAGSAVDVRAPENDCAVDLQYVVDPDSTTATAARQPES